MFYFVSLGASPAVCMFSACLNVCPAAALLSSVVQSHAGQVKETKLPVGVNVSVNVFVCLYVLAPVSDWQPLQQCTPLLTKCMLG